MMIDWNEYQKQIGATLGELMKLSPDTVRGYQTLSAANSKTGKLDEKTRQLISLAVAVTTRCDGCITVHSDAALKAGATREEIAEALEAVSVGAEDARGEPSERKNLAAVGVAGELERDALLLWNGQAVRHVGEQDAGAGAVEIGVGEDRAEALGIRGVVVRDAEDLEAVEIDGFVVEDTDAGIANGAQVAVGVGEFVVVAGDEVGTEFG